MSGGEGLSALLRRIKSREETALNEMYGATEPLLKTYVRRFVRDPWQADEVVQDVYLYVWDRAGDFRDERGSPLAWLQMLARSRALDSLRRNRNHERAAELDERVLPCSRGWQQGESTEVWNRVRQLPVAQERLISMAFVEGYTHAEIAQATGLPLGTVKARIRIALGKLRQTLADASDPCERVSA